jgi:hypothetical protein
MSRAFTLIRKTFAQKRSRYVASEALENVENRLRLSPSFAQKHAVMNLKEKIYNHVSKPISAAAFFSAGMSYNLVFWTGTPVYHIIFCMGYGTPSWLAQRFENLRARSEMG